MIAKPINSLIKKQVQAICKEAVQKAEDEYKTKIELTLYKLDHFNKLKILISEAERLDAVIEKHQYPFYIENHSSSEWLVNQFASRTFLLGVDESEELADAVFLGHYDSIVNQKKYELKDQIPKYSFKQFITGKICPYFEHFINLSHTTEEDYYKIRDWQAKCLTTIVNYEYLTLVKEIQLHCISIANPLDFIVEENEKIKSNLSKAPDNAKEIKGFLSDLYIFKNKSVNNLNDKLLIENFNVYKSEQLNWKGIHPTALNPIIDKISLNNFNTLTLEATLFYSLNKVTEWFELIMEGQPLQQKVVDPDWESLLNEVRNNAVEIYSPLIKELQDFAINPANTKNEIGEYLFNKLELYRHKFNNLKNKDYFSCLSENKTELLKRTFITNSFFGNDLNKESEIIKESIIINEMSWSIVEIYHSIFDHNRIGRKKDSDAEYQIMSLMHRMVLDKELYKGLKDSLDEFMEQFHSCYLPLDIYHQNQREYMKILFDKSINRLQDVLDDADPSNKILFLQSRLKELRQWEMRLKIFDEHETPNKKTYKYSEIFKEFLLIEAEFINEIKDIYPVTELQHPNKAKLLLVKKVHTFDTLLPANKAIFVLQMLEDLGITVNNKSAISERRKGALRGLVEALKENDILPNQSLEALNNLVAEKIGLILKSKIDWSKTSDAYFNKGKKYIINNYNK